MKNRIIILTAVLLFAMSLTAFAQGGILDRARQILDAIDNTGGTQTQQPQQPTQQPTNTNTQSTNQQPTLDKLRFGKNAYATTWTVYPINNWITGAVVIPATHENMSVTSIGSFRDITGITSVVIPDSVKTSTGTNTPTFRGCTGLTSVTIGAGMAGLGSEFFRGSGLTSVTIPATTTSIGHIVFQDCTNLTSVTFQGQTNIAGSTSFPGDLRAKYLAANGGPGTYTRSPGGTTWTKQSSIAYTPPAPAPAPAPVINTSLNGVWVIGDSQITINGSTGVVSSIVPSDLITKDAVNKGYIKVGDQWFRNLRSTTWGNCTFTMSADGLTIVQNNGTTYTRQ